MERTNVTLRPISELDIDAAATIDEKIRGAYKPEDWERRFMYYLRRDPELSLVAEVDGGVVGFMLGEVRAGEFGLEEPAGWIEVMGVDPDHQGKAIGRQLLAGMMEGFKRHGAKSVRTLVDEKTQEGLLRFFRSGGFESTPIRTLEHKL